jgi:hypothetical protein
MLLMVCAEVVPVGVLMAAVAYERWQRKRVGERAPQEDKLLRGPGHTLRVQLEDQWDRFNMWFVLSIFGGVLCGFMLAFNVPGFWAGCLTATLVAAVGVVMGWRALRAIRLLRLGLMGEQAVAEHLQSLIASGYRVFHDVPGSGKWNIDHVIVGPAGVFAIETKTRTKKPGHNAKKDYEVSFDGERLIFPSGTDAKASRQARSNANWLGQEMSKATGERVTARAILALPGWFVTMKVRSELKVFNAKQVPGFVLKEPRILGDETIQRIAYQLEQRCRDVEF